MIVFYGNRAEVCCGENEPKKDLDLIVRHTFAGHIPKERDEELSRLLKRSDKAKVSRNKIIFDKEDNIMGYERCTILGKSKISITEEIYRMKYPDAQKDTRWVQIFCKNYSW